MKEVVIKIKFILLTFLIIGCKSIQTSTNNSKVLEKQYHCIINEIVQNNISAFESKTEPLFQKLIEIGQSTPEQIERRRTQMYQNSRTVYLEQTGFRIRSADTGNINIPKELLQYFSLEDVKKALVDFDSSNPIKINPKLLDSTVIIKENSNASFPQKDVGGLLFSPPLLIGKYIYIDYTILTGKNEGGFEYLIYEIKEDGSFERKGVFSFGIF